MKKCLFLRVLTMVIISALMLSGIAVAADTAEVVFKTTEIEGDIVKLTLAVKNVTFMGIQTALKYNTEVLVPAKPNGEKADEYADFAKRTDMSEPFKTVGLALDTEKGYFCFTYYIMPGTENENINEFNEYVVPDGGVELCDFYFKRIAGGDCGFEMLFGKNNGFAGAVEPGIYIMDYAMGHLTANVTFLYEDREPETMVVKPVVPQQGIKLTAADRKKDVICMQIGKARAISKGKKAIIDPENTRVVPYIANDRTLVPIRFITEALGAEILWEDGWTYCIIKKEEKEIKLNFNSAEFEVNGEKITFDAPVELTQDRTMVPVRFVSEHLDCDVYWSERHKAVVIAPKDNPWQADREAEITALNEMLVSITGILP